MRYVVIYDIEEEFSAINASPEVEIICKGGKHKRVKGSLKKLDDSLRFVNANGIISRLVACKKEAKTKAIEQNIQDMIELIDFYANEHKL